MIQELLGGLMEEEKMILMPSSNFSAVSSGDALASVAAVAASSEPLRCPRCDSSNTKFCYYNNYNLMQPRHFCKACRRYWTKGGALRNVPIGGGCRKAKPSAIPLAAAPKPSTSSAINKPKPKPSIDDTIPAVAGTTPSFFWPTPHASQLMTLLKGAPMQDPLPAAAVNQQSWDALGQLPMPWRSGTQFPSPLPPVYQQQQQSMLLGTPQNSGIQELLHRLRSPSNYYSDPSSHLGLPSAATMSSTIAATGGMLTEPVPPIELGFSNPAIPWADISMMSNGVFH